MRVTLQRKTSSVKQELLRKDSIKLLISLHYPFCFSVLSTMQAKKAVVLKAKNVDLLVLKVSRKTDKRQVVLVEGGRTYDKLGRRLTHWLDFYYWKRSS